MHPDPHLFSVPGILFFTMMLLVAAGLFYIGPINTLLLFKQRKMFIPGVSGRSSAWVSRDSEPIGYWIGFAVTLGAFPAMASWFVVFDLNFFFNAHITVFSAANALLARH